MENKITKNKTKLQSRETPQIAVIVLNWNGVEDTIECVESILKQSYKAYKLFIIDNNSDNNEYNNLKNKYQERAGVIKNSTNLGFTLAHNEIFQNIIDLKIFDYVALLNNDAVADSNWLEQLIDVMQKDPDVGIVTGKLIKYNNREEIDNVGLDLLWTGEVAPTGEFEACSKYSNMRQVTSGSGAGCLYSTKMLEEIGLFDTYFKTGYEDSELGLRANLAGYKAIYTPNSIAYHKGSKSVNKVRTNTMSYKLYLNIYYSYLKLMPIKLILVMIPIWLVRAMAVILISAIFLKFSIAKTQFKSISGLTKAEFWKKVREERKKFLPQSRANSLAIVKLHKLPFSYYFKYFSQIFLKKNKLLESKLS